MTHRTTYCIDTSGLTAGFRDIYPFHIFGALWDRMSELVEEGRLVAPEEVFKELQKQDDPLYRWVNERRGMFVPPDLNQRTVIFQIARDFPQVATGPTTVVSGADPWVVALAKARRLVVVSGEKRESPKRPKIPQICRHYQIPHVEFLHIVRAEGWTFP